VLNDFRAWLGELAALPEPAEAVETIDLHAVVGQFTALRHEVNLQTKATRSAVDQLGPAAEALKDRPAADDGLKPVLKAVVDVYDNLALAMKQVERQRAAIEPVLTELAAGAEVPEPPEVPAAGMAGVSDRPRGFWSRLFGGAAVPPEFAGVVHRQMLIDWREGVLKDAEARRSRVTDTVNQVRSSLDGLIAGYRMSLNRVDRAVGLVGLEPIPAVGGRFDPELMEAVEVVADPGRPAGEVVEEVRRGYRWRGVVFRFAQVKVSR
jgi:molecular chaperone GrpE